MWYFALVLVIQSFVINTKERFLFRFQAQVMQKNDTIIQKTTNRIKLFKFYSSPPTGFWRRPILGNNVERLILLL